jgi:hypothetical protein
MNFLKNFELDMTKKVTVKTNRIVLHWNYKTSWTMCWESDCR